MYRNIFGIAYFLGMKADNALHQKIEDLIKTKAEPTPEKTAQEIIDNAKATLETQGTELTPQWLAHQKFRDSVLKPNTKNARRRKTS